MPNPNDKELNEVDWDKVWYGEFMTRLAHSDFEPCADIDGVLKIVAEAMRRGEVGAWEEMKIVTADVMDCSDDTVGHYEDALQKRIDTKLSSLTKK